MSYTAKHYVNIAGNTYVPDEIIDAIPDGKEKRLLKIGAVIDNGDNKPTFPYNDPTPPYDGNEPDTDASAMNPGSEEEPEAEEEFTEEAEVEEIDVMDDILPAAEEPEPEAEKKPRRGRSKA